MINEIEHIYGINLLSSVERKDLLLEECAKHNLEIEIFEATNSDNIENVEGEMRAEYRYLNQSIINVINDAKTNNYKSIMILEDDVIFHPNMVNKFNEIFEVRNDSIVYNESEVPVLDEQGNATGETTMQISKDIVPVADLPEEWNVLYLGMLSMQAAPKIFHNVHRVRKGVLGHAFCLNMRDTVFVNNLLSRLGEMNLQSDLCLAECYDDLENTFAYAILPSIAKQRVGYSDILKTIVAEKDYS